MFLNFLGALGFLTRVRVPDRALARPLNDTAKYFSLVGLLLGIVLAGIFAALSFVFPPAIAVTLVFAASALITGAFHEDGFADTVDGFGGGWTKEDVLRIMQDSRIGSFGALGLVLLVVLKIQSLSSIDLEWIGPTIILANALSRFVSTTFVFSHDYVRFEGKSKPLADGIDKHSLLLCAVFGLVPVALFPIKVGATILLVTVALWLFWSYRIRSRIGGYTGDTLGAIQQLTELLVFLVVAAWTFI
jgi:adenosylcobinamide-GDP ribazoletransferase